MCNGAVILAMSFIKMFTWWGKNIYQGKDNDHESLNGLLKSEMSKLKCCHIFNSQRNHVAEK